MRVDVFYAGFKEKTRGMINLIGHIPEAARQLDRGHLHDYGKAPRPGRKLGHITVVAESAAKRDRLLVEIGESVTDCVS